MALELKGVASNDAKLIAASNLAVAYATFYCQKSDELEGNSAQESASIAMQFGMEIVEDVLGKMRQQ